MRGDVSTGKRRTRARRRRGYGSRSGKRAAIEFSTPVDEAKLTHAGELVKVSLSHLIEDYKQYNGEDVDDIGAPLRWWPQLVLARNGGGQQVNP